MKKLISITGALLLLLALALPAWATVTVVNNNGCLTVTLDGSGDFAWASATVTSGTGSGTALTTLYPNGLQITKITIAAGAAGSKTFIRAGNSSSAYIPPLWYSVDGSPQLAYFTDGRWYTPSAYHADQTSDTGTVISFFYGN